MKSKGKKKPYSQPALNKLTRSQGIKLVAQQNNWSEQEAAKFVDSLGAPRQQTEEKQHKHGQSDGRDQKRKRSA
jgi:hypothetical protein